MANASDISIAEAVESAIATVSKQTAVTEKVAADVTPRSARGDELRALASVVRTIKVGSDFTVPTIESTDSPALVLRKTAAALRDYTPGVSEDDKTIIRGLEALKESLNV